jgi:hypothetical protein
MPGNVLVSADRRLAGVLDVGGLGPADPALDLLGAWHLLEAGSRRALREALGPSDLEWARGKAWAFQQSMGLVWYYADSNPVMAGIGRRTLDRLLADGRPLPPASPDCRAPRPAKKDQNRFISNGRVLRLAPRRRTPPSGCPATRPGRYQAMVAGIVAVVGGSRSCVYVPWLKMPNRKTGLLAKYPPSE